MATLQLTDATLHYQLAGQGPPVLLIHGTGVCGSGWEPQINGLTPDFQCLWFDNRGIGRSTSNNRTLTIEQMARDARALMDAVGWESAHVVGHSMGGLIAQQLALDVPRRVRSLSLLCTFARGPEAARLTTQTLRLGIRTRLGTRAMRRRAFLEMLFPQAFLQTQDTAALAARIGPIIGRDLADSPPIMMQQLSAMRAYDASARLGELSQIPTLVVAATHDPIALPQYGKRLSERIPGSQYLEIPDAAHGVTIQMPERINHLLKAHFDGRQAPRPEPLQRYSPGNH